MSAASHAAQMSLPGGDQGRAFHPGIVKQSEPLQIGERFVPSWNDERRFRHRNTLTCYESMISVDDGPGYTQGVEDFIYLRKTVIFILDFKSTILHTGFVLIVPTGTECAWTACLSQARLSH